MSCGALCSGLRGLAVHKQSMFWRPVGSCRLLRDTRQVKFGRVSALWFVQTSRALGGRFSVVLFDSTHQWGLSRCDPPHWRLVADRFGRCALTSLCLGVIDVASTASLTSAAMDPLQHSTQDLRMSAGCVTATSSQDNLLSETCASLDRRVLRAISWSCCPPLVNRQPSGYRFPYVPVSNRV